jgi:hypothetical protein
VGCVKTNHIISSFTYPSLYVLQQQGQLQEGQQGWTMSRPITTPDACTNQEGENDDYMDINYMVMAESIIEFQAQGELKSSVGGLLCRRRSYKKKYLRKINTRSNAEATIQGASAY